MRAWFRRLGRWDKLLLALVAAYLALWPLEPLTAVVYGIRVALQIVIYLVGSVVLGRLVYRIARSLVRRFLWRVRHRMAAVYILVGVIPLGLALLLGAFGLLLVFGPLAAYMVSVEVEERAEAFYATADSLAWQVRAAEPAERIEIGRRFLIDARSRYPGLLVRFDGPDGPVTVPSGFAADAPPQTLESYRGIVRRDDAYYLAAYAEFEPGTPSLLLMAPLTEEYLLELVPGLGIVRLMDARAPARAEVSRFGIESAYADESPATGVRRARPRRNRPLQSYLPEPAHPFDWPVDWRAQVPVLDWGTGDVRPENAFRLTTRSSAVVRLVLGNQSPETAQMARTLGYALFAMFGAALLLSTVLAVSLTRTVTSSINELYIGTRHVDEGDFSYRVPVQGYSQLTELARSFNHMTGSIQHLIEDSKERERLESELAIAQEVQGQLFPKGAPRLKTFEALGVCRPARLVSGDFYDYVRLSETRLAISFGDVSGKGISAALVMAAVHSTVRTQLAAMTGGDDLAEAARTLVSETNRQLCAGTTPEKFATLFFGIYDDERSELAYANAGHLPPILVREGGTQRLEVTGMVVGAFTIAEYEARVIKMEPGDLLAIFTDGVSEPENPYEEQFGEDRLEDLLLRESDRPLADIIRASMEEVEGWTGDVPELQDDMTMLTARRLG